VKRYTIDDLLNEIFSPVVSGITDEMRQALKALVEALPPRDALAISQLYFEGKSQMEIARSFPRANPRGGVGVSRAQIASIKARGIRMLRHPKRRATLIPFLGLTLTGEEWARVLRREFEAVATRLKWFDDSPLTVQQAGEIIIVELTNYL
jgi:hypothetical protein